MSDDADVGGEDAGEADVEVGVAVQPDQTEEAPGENTSADEEADKPKKPARRRRKATAADDAAPAPEDTSSPTSGEAEAKPKRTRKPRAKAKAAADETVEGETPAPSPAAVESVAEPVVVASEAAEGPIVTETEEPATQASPRRGWWQRALRGDGE